MIIERYHHELISLVLLISVWIIVLCLLLDERKSFISPISSFAKNLPELILERLKRRLKSLFRFNSSRFSSDIIKLPLSIISLEERLVLAIIEYSPFGSKPQLIW